MPDFVAGLFPNNGWAGDWPITSANAAGLTSYAVQTKIDRAIRERGPITSAGTTALPPSTFPWLRGTITAVEDHGDGTIGFTANDTAGAAIDWSAKFTAFAALTNDSGKHYAPSAYKICLYPADNPNATGLGDPNYAPHPFPESSHDSTFFNVADDGGFIINGLTLSDYVGFNFTVLRSGGSGTQAGYSFPQRYPPVPNDTEYDYGIVTRIIGGATSGSDSTHVEDTARTTIADPNLLIPDYYVNRWSIQISDEYRKITAQNIVGGHAVFTVASGFVTTVPGSGYTLVSATTTSITDPRDASSHGFKCPKDWPNDLKDDFGFFREAMCLCGTLWRRIKIVGFDPDAPAPTLLFDDADVYGNQITVPPSNYWLVDEDSWWRPEFRLQLERRIGRDPNNISSDGDFAFWSRIQDGIPQPWFNSTYSPWSANGGAPWQPLALWTSAYTDRSDPSHEPATDTIYSVPHYVDSITLAFDTGDDDVTVFDVDANTGVDETPFEDSLFNPYLQWTIRGRQIKINDLFGGAPWVAPIDYSGKQAIPLLTQATWQQLYNPGNTRTAQIISIASGVATVAVAMPKATPGQTYASLRCDWTLQDANGDTKQQGLGTVTATTLTADSYSFDDTPDTGDAGLTVVIAFGRTRKYERRFRYLYWRIFAQPSLDGDGHEVWPPTSDAPGIYLASGPSSIYAEYTAHGTLQDTATAFIAGESARYVADNLFDPYGDGSAWTDVAYQGRPNVTSQSNFPRWEGSKRAGTATKAESYSGGGYIEDATQEWELSTSPSIQWTGTIASGSTVAIASANDGVSTITTATDGRWTSAAGARFENLLPIIQVSNDSGVTYVPRPATAYDSTTQTFTTVAFPFSVGAKPFIVDEPGKGSGGVLAHVWKGKTVTITSADGSATSDPLPILASDRHRVFWTGDAGFTVTAGCTYAIDQIEPGAVLQYRPDGKNPVNGFVSPENAIQDTRGQKWHLKEQGLRENCPTIVTNYGLFQCGDISTAIELWNEMYASLDCLRWIKITMGFSSRSPSNFASDTEEDNHKVGNSGSLISGGPAFPTYGDDSTPLSALHITNDAILDYNAVPADEQDGDPPAMFWNNGVGDSFQVERRYAYGIATATTDQLASSMTMYICADDVTPGAPPTTAGLPFNLTSFDDYGTGLTLGTFLNYTELPPSADVNRRASTPFPSTALTLPANPPNTAYSGASPNPSDPFYPDGLAAGLIVLEDGFVITRQFVIEKFDVPGGLRFVTPLSM